MAVGFNLHSPCIHYRLWPSHFCHVGPIYHVLDEGAHWRHLANTLEASVRGGDVDLCQNTLTTY